MWKTIKYILVIGFFPVTIFCLVMKYLYRLIEKKFAKKYIASISIDEIDILSGEEFEDLLSIYFKSLGLKVTKTKRSHDYGADLLVKSKTETIAIQCKLYYKRTVGNSAVQEIASAKEFYSANRAVVITNSTFTKPAEVLADKIGVNLINRTGLINMLSYGNTNF